MSIPNSADIPDIVVDLAADREIIAVWQNELGGTTFRLGDDEYVKWFRGTHREIDFDGETARMRWAVPYVSVPIPIEVGRRDGEQWLRTQALAAESAVHPHHVADAAKTVSALGVGLRRFHDRLPLTKCPYSWKVADRIANRPSPSGRVSALLEHAPNDVEADLVVCHGDACSPNFLLADGVVVGYVDVGRLGVADRWADLAPALMSLTWNFGGGWDDDFLQAYGIEFDVGKYDFYRALWEVA